MAYTFARIGAVVSLTPQDYFQIGKRAVIRFREKGGKEKELPAHHKLEEYLDVYLEAAQLSEQPASLLFRSTRGRSRELGPTVSRAKTLGLGKVVKPAKNRHVDISASHQLLGGIVLLVRYALR